MMAWPRPGDKSLSEPMVVSLLTHICITRPQWVNNQWLTLHTPDFIMMIKNVSTDNMYLPYVGPIIMHAYHHAEINQTVSGRQQHWTVLRHRTVRKINNLASFPKGYNFFQGDILISGKTHSYVSLLTHSGLVTPYGDRSGSTLAHDGTKPLPEPKLTDHRWSPMTFISGQFHNRCLIH